MSLNLRPDEIVTFEDGFKYFWPTNYKHGAFSAHNLREIANHLDELNREWQRDIDEYFLTHPENSV